MQLTVLGNTHDEDSDKEAEPPVKVIDKTPMRTTKRNAPAEAPSHKTQATNEGRSGPREISGNEAGKLLQIYSHVFPLIYQLFISCLQILVH